MQKVIFLMALIFAINLNAQTSWKLDKAHAKMTFTVTHMGISEVDGVFKDFDASITTSKEDFSDAVFETTADLTAITTNNEKRDADLQKEGMFDTANHPTLTFKSTGIERVEEKKFKLTGDLTIKGVTKTVSLDLTLLGMRVNPRSQKIRAGFKVGGIINRTDFGVGKMPAMMVGNDVELRASGEFVKQ